jgi:hypothetical protein
VSGVACQTAIIVGGLMLIDTAVKNAIAAKKDAGGE